MKVARTVWTYTKSERIVRDVIEPAQISSVTGSGAVLTVTFTQAVYPYSGGGYDPEDEGMWSFSDNDGSGVTITSVVLSANHKVATVTLTGSVATGDKLSVGDLHNINMQCFNSSFDTATRTAGGWTIGDN